MAEVEAPTEAILEEIQHHAKHALEHGPEHAAENSAAHHSTHKKDMWISQVALGSAMLAVFAAIAALVANHHANEAMIEQIHASDQWSYYQAKSIKAAMLSTKIELLGSLGKNVSEKDHEKLAQYKEEQEQISEKAEENEKASTGHLHHHVILARSVTLFQVAIAIAAIAVLSKRRKVWWLGLGFGFAGLIFFVQGFL